MDNAHYQRGHSTYFSGFELPISTFVLSILDLKYLVYIIWGRLFCKELLKFETLLLKSYKEFFVFSQGTFRDFLK